MSLRPTEDELLFHADDYNHFFLSNGDTEALQRDLVRFVRDAGPMSSTSIMCWAWAWKRFMRCARPCRSRSSC